MSDEQAAAPSGGEEDGPPAPPPEMFHTTQKEAVEVGDYVSDDGTEPVSEEASDDGEEASEAAADAYLRELEGRCHILDERDAAYGGGKAQRDDMKGDPLLKYINQHSGIFSTHKTDAEVKAAVADKRKVQVLRDAKNSWDKKCEAAEDARQVLASEEAKLKEMQNTRSAEEIFVQADEVERSWQRLTDLEKDRDSAELKLHEMIGTASEAERACLQKEFELSIIAQQRQQDEVARGERIIEKMWEKDYLKMEKRAADKAEKDRKAMEAEKNRKLNNKKHLTPALVDEKQKVAQAAAVRDEKWNHRTKAMLQLKKNLDEINAKIASTNEKKEKKALAAEKQKKQREIELMEQGLNPYEVFRREQVEADLDRNKVEGAALKQMRNEKLLKSLIREDQEQQAKEAEDRRLQEFEIAYQREQAGQSKDVKMADYIKKVTLNHVDILDPTGAAMRIDPSKVTAVKTGGFGLGKAPPEELAAVEERLAFQKKKVAVWDRQDARKADDGMGFLGGDDGRAGTAGAEDDEKEPLPDGKLWLPKRTVLEEKMLAEAKKEHRRQIDEGEVQRCWGKTFKGAAFIPKPSVIEYLDFDADEKYKQVIEVTNVSLTFNQFKLLPMDDRYQDFFDIGFDPPGRMSAGVSCKITLRYMPKLFQDIWTTFPILAKTGRIDFPIMCLTKKTVLDLEPKELSEEEKQQQAVSGKQKVKKKGPPDPAVPPELRDAEYWRDPSEILLVDFGNVVFGEWSTREVQIMNTGALPAGYSIREAVVEDEPIPELERQNEHRRTRMLASDPWQKLRTGSDMSCSPAKDAGGLGGGTVDAALEDASGGDGGSPPNVSTSRGDLPDLATNTASGSSGLPSMLAFAETGSFVARGSSKIEFIFTPRHLGEFSCKFVIEVDNKAPGDARFQKRYFLKMVGRCIDVPIYAEREVYNLHTILYEHTFRELIVLKNRSSVAMKVRVERPKLSDPRLLPGEIQISPDTAYVQGLGQQSIQFKVVLQRDFLDRNPQYKRDDRKYGPASFKIPVKMVGADQVLPVWTCITGNLTQNDISFAPDKLDFGSVFVDAARYKKVTITNHSKLPQSLCFAGLPSYLSVQNVAKEARDEDDRYGVILDKSACIEHGGNGFLVQLLPDESLPVTVCYAPTAATGMKTALNIHALTAQLCSRSFSVPCTGQGKMLRIALDRNFLKFPAIGVGAQGKESFEVTNVSKNKTYEISVLCPPRHLARLWISPVCIELKPGEKTRVQIEFKPNKLYESLLRNASQDMDDLPAEVAGGLTDMEAIPDEDFDEAAENLDPNSPLAGLSPTAKKDLKAFRQKPRSEIVKMIQEAGGRRWEHRRSNITGQTILQQGKAVELSKIDSQHAIWKIPLLIRPVVIVDSKRVYNTPDEECEQLAVCVRTTCVPPVLVPTPDRCDFGEVTVFQRKLIHVTLRCKVDDMQEIFLTSPLPETSCLSVLNACGHGRIVRKEKQFQIVIEFCPQAAQLYSTVLKLHTPTTRIQIPIKGCGVTPRLYIPNQFVHFPACVYGTDTVVSEKVQFFNTTRFQLDYEISSVSRNFIDNCSGAPCFMLEPKKGRIKGKDTDESEDTSLSVEVKFRPHRIGEIMKEKVYVFVPNQDFPCTRCTRYTT
ncbi:unnamed protein product [Amoebophrya sp. A25]|nr:unnamed protein product [Amoebophrya sp. A25]|eukprot:GSA25T00019723001.1